jgi:predicted transposase YbfD/YdcC
LDNRKYSYAAISPVEAGLPYARSTYQCQRTWVDKKDLEDPDLKVKSHTRYFLSTLNPGDDLRKLSQAAGVIRNHWAVENKNHYKKDTCPWVEDDHRHRRVNAAQNLALTRSALLAIIPFDETKNLNSCLESYQAYPARALKLIRHARPI